MTTTFPLACFAGKFIKNQFLFRFNLFQLGVSNKLFCETRINVTHSSISLLKCRLWFDAFPGKRKFVGIGLHVFRSFLVVCQRLLDESENVCFCRDKAWTRFASFTRKFRQLPTAPGALQTLMAETRDANTENLFQLLQPFSSDFSTFVA